MKNIIALTLLWTAAIPLMAQQGDSVVVRVGEQSRVTILIKDQKDLQTLKHYNFQALMDDLIEKLEKRDSTPLARSNEAYRKDTTTVDAQEALKNWSRDNNDEEPAPVKTRSHRKGRTHHSINFDLGTNNYLSDGKFPDASSLYTVRPWGSWSVAIQSIWRSQIAGKLYLEWGGGVSWYNFKYENPRTVISKDATGVVFSEDNRDLDFRKSKLTVAYLNAQVIPVIDFGRNGHKPSLFDGGRSKSFRIGAGPYAGYRIDSYSKQTIFENGEKHRYHDHDNFYLNNIRYGVRLQLGFRDTDIFFAYDMNELFTEGKGPKLNAFSFGITL